VNYGFPIYDRANVCVVVVSYIVNHAHSCWNISLSMCDVKVFLTFLLTSLSLYIFTIWKSIVYRLLTDVVCLYTYEFLLSLCKIVRSSKFCYYPYLNVHMNCLPFGGLNQILKRQTSHFHYGSKIPAVTIAVFITILEQNRLNSCQTSIKFSECKCQKHFYVTHW
jgi:hypothetical protein